ncbi:MAG: ferrous iron transport protein B [Oscillospiraceae bacterium]|nr:ferrous iron transport protein B [Oscillospiraceae bacterium]
MGLTHSSTGLGAVDSTLVIQKTSPGQRVIALAGNPNVGKSTLFNALTGMNQHTGNWPGKTVTNAQGRCAHDGQEYILVDLPGTYSLMAHSAEEEVARNFICFGSPDAVAVVCDATCLERNMNLVLQTLELTGRAVVCVNLMDEAKRKGIHIDLKLLSKRLGVPVVGTVARKKRSLNAFLSALDTAIQAEAPGPVAIPYPQRMEQALSALTPLLEERCGGRLNPRWLALKLLEGDEALLEEAGRFLNWELTADEALMEQAREQRQELERWGFTADRLRDFMVSALVSQAEGLCRGAVRYEKDGYDQTDRQLDRILTSKSTGYPLMIALLAAVFWLTIVGANYPSQLLSQALFRLQDRLSALFAFFHAPAWLHGALVLGVYRVLAWVVSVMLPPMAIFFPLFTLLEDAGYLPRIAYNLDRPFQKCSACGKQALTMCMGFGCNAAGVVGCRIIDSPRERLLAILTNNFVPCNGRFPTLIAILTMFFVGTAGGLGSSLLSALLLTLVILLGVGLTFAATRLLSATVLRGVPSSFTLELPPYRKPQVGRVIVRSIFDRTLFVLGRAAAVAAPAGLLIWLMANVTVGGATLLTHCAGFLDPFARLMGLDGVILMAFILGFPANEIVVPIILMAYLSQGALLEMDSLAEMRALFLANGWTWVTAVNVMLFSLMHWPCSTTLLTIRKETGSWKWTALAAALPTAAGVGACMIFTALARLVGG